MTTQEMYEKSIKSLPAAERLRLATLILNDISPRAVVDYSDEWSDEDLQDFTKANMKRIGRLLEAEEQ